MHSNTDYIVLAFVAFYFLSGWRKGFWKTILGPISLVIGWGLSMVYYFQTKNLVVSLILSIFGPFFVRIVLSIFLKVLRGDVDKERPPVTFGRLLGAMISVFWSGSLLLLTIILCAIVPLNFKWYQPIKRDITNSKSFIWINQLSGDRFANASLGTKEIANILKDPEKLEQLQTSVEYKAIMADRKVKALLDDEKSVKQMEEKDYVELLSNPRILAIASDSELLQKFLSLNQKLVEMEEKKREKKKKKERTEIRLENGIYINK